MALVEFYCTHVKGEPPRRIPGKYHHAAEVLWIECVDSKGRERPHHADNSK